MNKTIFFILIILIITVQSQIKITETKHRTSVSGSYDCKLKCDKKVSDGDTCNFIIILEGFENSRSDTSFWIEIRPEKGIKLVNKADSLIQVFNPDTKKELFYEKDKIKIKVMISDKKYHLIKTKLIYNKKEMANCYARGRSSPK
jgi:hypothetical protein